MFLSFPRYLFLHILSTTYSTEYCIVHIIKHTNVSNSNLNSSLIYIYLNGRMQRHLDVLSLLIYRMTGCYDNIDDVDDGDGNLIDINDDPIDMIVEDKSFKAVYAKVLHR